MHDLVTKTSEAMDAASALAAVTEVAACKANAALKKMAQTRSEDCWIAASAATMTSQDAKFYVNAYEKSKALRDQMSYTRSSVASRGLAAAASRGVTAQTSAPSMPPGPATRDAMARAVRSARETVAQAQQMVEDAKHALQLAEETLAAAEQSNAAAEATWTWP